MRLSGRRFTQDFKLTAVRQLEQGVAVGEVARGLEVNPNVLPRWRREFRQGPGNAFPGYAALPKWRRNARRPSRLDLITLPRKERAEHPHMLASYRLHPSDRGLVAAAAA